ncbi:hypothetical protein AU255_00695 [Methyloprofundus sedimenti]|uniref:Aminotransferase class III n=2 Tax=Methyloprofundus sedimenti TaxID=1420851 RepID=A0A1V8M4H7_9GAMM|nr:hypothetical protein AU255_00695 [Methyloprofundus sedimenti]
MIVFEDMKLRINSVSISVERKELSIGGGLYKPATSSILNTIQQRNQTGKVTFLLASQPIFAESAQAAYLLCEYINVLRKKGTRKIYKTFFCNSRIEALHGAIKISRHNAGIIHSNSTGNVLVYDKGRYYDALFDPLSQGSSKALVPNVFFYDVFSDLLNYLNKSCVSTNAVVFCLYDDFSIDCLNDIQQICKENKATLVIDTSHVTDRVIELALSFISYTPDIIIWGEELTDHQVPFAAFSVIDNLYRVWGNISTCFIHSSTYGGNSLVTSIVRDRVLEKISVTSDILFQLENIADNLDARMEIFRTYINSMTPLIYRAAKLDLDIISAKGSKITIKDQYGKKVNLIDCIGGAGSNLRGYNPDDIGRLLETHQPTFNYWKELAHMLSDLTGLGNVFPAVSGACAVDIAMSLAMLANSGKSIILVFKGNYAGKTMISINGSEEEFDRKPFAPLYWDVVYLDIFAENAEAELLKELQSGKIALVWFEVMQGNSLDRVPSRLMDIIFEYKKDYDYIIGIDEILNGMFRTGPFVSFNRTQYEPDIITLSKGLSDLTFPVSAVLFTDEIYSRAKLVNEKLVTRYQSLFLNQLGAHIALNSLINANKLYGKDRIKNAGGLLKSELNKIVKQSPLLKEIRGEGLHLQLLLDLERFPLSLFGKDISELLVSRLFLSQGHVLQYFCRLLPPLNISDSEILELVAGIEKSLKINRLVFFLFGLKHGFIFLYLLMVAQFRSGVAQLVGSIKGEAC